MPTVELTENAIFGSFQKVATDVLPEHFRPDSCLNATRVTIEVLRAFGVAATPMSVHFMAVNQIYHASMVMNGGVVTPEALRTWMGGGGWSVGVDAYTTPDAGSWAGHLVAVTSEFLIDASARQFSRPERTITIPDVFIGKVSARFKKGKVTSSYAMADGSQLSYRARPADRSFRALEGFQPHEGNKRAIIYIIEGMRRDLAKT